MVTVSIIIPAWNEAEHIADCLMNATRQTVAAKEILVVDNKSTDNTMAIVEQFIAENPDCNVKLLEQNEKQGLIPTRNYGFNHAIGDVYGRIDADCMLRPDWVEQVTKTFAHDRSAMGVTGPVTYYDMPAADISLAGDNQIRRHVYKADGGRTLLFGSNMAIRAKAWKVIKDQVCADEEDLMHEDIDLSLHLIANGLKTVYNPKVVVGMSARRMDTSLPSFINYMKRFKRTFDAHPGHTRTSRPEYIFTALYPILHAWYPVYQKQLHDTHIDPARRIWFRKQMQLARRRELETYSTYQAFESRQRRQTKN